MKKRAKRDWYVAYGDVSGEYEGAPLSFDASEVYGPYTAAQAYELSKLSSEFPHATKCVRIFKVAVPSFRSLKRSVLVDLDQAKADEAARKEGGQ